MYVARGVPSVLQNGGDGLGPDRCVGSLSQLVFPLPEGAFLPVCNLRRSTEYPANQVGPWGSAKGVLRWNSPYDHKWYAAMAPEHDKQRTFMEKIVTFVWLWV